MSNENFKEKCNVLSERLSILYKMLGELKEQIVLQDLSEILGTPIKSGRNFVSGLDWIEETSIDGEIFDLTKKSCGKYSSYVTYLEKEYNTIGLGFMYKGELIAPHMKSYIDDLLSRFNDLELKEILVIVEKAINDINHDIVFLSSNLELHLHKHYYGEYNKGFDSRNRYETIFDVINNFKMNVKSIL